MSMRNKDDILVAISITALIIGVISMVCAIIFRSSVATVTVLACGLVMFTSSGILKR